MLTLTILVLVAITAKEANAYYPLCESYSGSHFFTFSGTYENIRLPCKYPAIRNTRCGKYSITLTPGNVLDEEGQRFLPDTLWLRVEDTETDLRFEGRTSQKKASRWINLKGSPDPYNQKDGQLKFRDLFYTFTDGTYVGIVEKSATFAIGYYLYNATAQKHFLKSGFSFVCLSPEFTPSDYPEQLCGNQTANEVFLHKKEMGQEDRRVTLIYNVLMDSTVTQIDPNCRTSGRVLRSDACKDKSYDVTHACSPILTKLENRKSITASSSSVISAFMHCTEYLCRDDKDACLSLSDELASVPSLRDEILKGDDCQISV